MLRVDLVVILAVGLVAVNAAAVDDDSSSSSSSEEIDVAQPSMFGMLGSKAAIADNVYEEYDDDDDASEVELEAPPKPCCFPSTWQGRITTKFGLAPIGGGRRPRLGGDDDDDNDFDNEDKKKKHERRRGGPIASRSVNKVYVDGANKRLAGDVLECHGRGHVMNFSYILLVGANKTADLYLFDRTAEKCRHRQLTGAVWRDQCIPPSATLRGQFSLGPATGGLAVQSWSFSAGSKRAKAALIDGDYSAVGDEDDDATPRPRPKPRPKVFVEVNALVVPGSCVPVVVQEEGVVLVGGGPRDEVDSDNWNSKPRPRPKPRCKPRGEAFVGGAYYSGLQTTITDPTVFNVPSFCKTTPNTLFYDEMEDKLPTVVERFLML